MSDAPVVFHEPSTRNGMRIGVAELNRPARLNALDLDMCLLMLERFRAWRADPTIACVLLHGRGEKGFCAGGDVARVVREVRRATSDRYDYGDAFFTAEY